MDRAARMAAALHAMQESTLRIDRQRETVALLEKRGLPLAANCASTNLAMMVQRLGAIRSRYAAMAETVRLKEDLRRLKEARTRVSR